MSENKKSIDVKSWGTVIAIVSAFATFSAILFQYGFWLRFNINPLSYATFSEITANIIIVLIPISILALILAGPFYMLLLFVKKPLDELKKLCGRDFSEGIIDVALIISIIGFIVVIFDLIPIESNDKKLMTRYWTSLPLIFVAVKISFNLQLLKITIPNELYRISILFFLCFTPILCYWTGNFFANSIFKNESYSFIPANYVPESIKKISDDKDIKYIGKIGEHIFLSSLDNKTLIVMLETDVSPLILKEYESN